MVPKLTVWTVNHALSFQRWFTFFTYVRTIWRIIFFVCIVINFFLLKMFFRFTRCSLFYIIAAFVRFYLVFPGFFFVFFFNFLKILLGLDTLNFLDGFNSGSSTIGWFISFKHTYFFFIWLLFLSVYCSFDGSLHWFLLSSMSESLMFLSSECDVCSSSVATFSLHFTYLYYLTTSFHT